MEGFIQNSEPSFSNVPYGQRWELLKPYLEQLYIQESRKLSEIVDIMKTRHKFYASESQYKRKFGSWKLKKNIPTSKKTAICDAVYTRAQMGKSSLIKYKGQEVDPEKLRRLVKTKRRQDIMMEIFMSAERGDIDSLSGHALQCGNRIFMNWEMPYIKLRIPRIRAYDHVSPFGPPTTTPVSDIMVDTPSSITNPSPRNLQSPRDAMSPMTAPSPMTIAIRDNVKIDRARLFVQARHTELIKGLSREEKKTMTDWMHHFWLFSYKTAKLWGRGPRKWTSFMLGLDEYSATAVSSLPASPGLTLGSPSTHGASQQNASEHQNKCILRPTALCQWSIHMKNDIRYERCQSPPLHEPENVDPNDEKSWTPWLNGSSMAAFVDTLQGNLESNDFSSIEIKDLPICATQVVKAAKRSPEMLREEAFGFSIMARNINLIEGVLLREDLGQFANGSLYPLHLAASYIDGGKTCCGVFNSIVMGMPAGEASVRKLYINHLNHTVLDNLMIAILKAHTSCLPSMVDDAFKKEQRFAGEEVDICGRWDADSKCIRALLTNGIPTIPFEWKHMFCHTSVQAICHCIMELFGPCWAPDINTPSGIFTRRCHTETCGLKLQMMPLHTLVVTAVNLASQGSNGETLFGMLACLLCLLDNGANPLLTADVSINALLGTEDGYGCSHEELNPLEFAKRVPDHIMCRWSHEVKTGWQLFCFVIELSQAEKKAAYGFREDNDDDEDDEDDENEEDDKDDEDDEDDMSIDDSDEEDKDAICERCQISESPAWKNRDLATLWAAVQTEFVTYRQLREGDPWISSNFDMESLLESLTSGQKLSIDLVQEGMMKSYGKCGHFFDADPVCVRSQDVSRFYFANLDDWNRTTFLDISDHLDAWFG